MRTDIKFELRCAECGKLLEADSARDKSKMRYHSAYNASCEMHIKPCQVCYAKARRPAELIKEALDTVN